VADKFILTYEDLTNNLDNEYLMRGIEYARQNRIVKLRADKDVFGELDIQSSVRGSYLYQQHIRVSHTSYGIEIDGDCSCPVGYNCKHCAAVLVTLIERNTESSDDAKIHQWLSLWKEMDSPSTPSQNNNSFLIFRLFESPDNHVSFYKAKYLKDGSVSKGRKIATDDLLYYPSSYKYDYLTDEDYKLIADLGKLSESDYYRNDSVFFSEEFGALVLRKLIRSGKAFYQNNSTPLSLTSAKQTLTLVWKKLKDGMHYLQPDVSADKKVVATTWPPFCIDTQTDSVSEMEVSHTRQELAWMLNAPLLTSKEILRAANNVLQNHPEMDFPLPPDTTREIIEGHPTPRLRLFGTHAARALAVTFGYGGCEIKALPSRERSTLVQDEQSCVLHRRLDEEAHFRHQIEAHGFEYHPPLSAYLSPAHPTKQAALERWRLFLEEGLPALQAEGWEITKDSSFSYTFTPVETVIVETEEEEEGNQWFSLSFHVEVGGESIALLPVVSHLLEEFDSVESLPPRLNLEYHEGHFLHVDAQEIAPVLQTLFELFDKRDGDALKVAAYDAHLIHLDEHAVWKGSDELKALSQQLKNFTGIESIAPADTLRATLRAYQQFGLDWLHFLHAFGFGGILADDMGLGKTVQTLALLQYLKAHGRLNRPSLIVVPTSLIGNWKAEINKFTPDLTCCTLYGTNRAEKFDTLEAYDVIITTYALAQRDKEQYNKHAFAYLILDEAQKIKNPATKMAKAIKTIQSRHRLALTGTPIENHLGELWSIFDFVMPGFLGDLSLFRELYQKPIEKEHDVSRQELLNKKVAPFILRRTKEKVARELPSKTEIVKRVSFGSQQAKLYETIRITMEKKVREAIQTKGAARSHITILDALLKLRQVCNHPQLLKLESAKKLHESAKMELFIDLLEELMDEGRKVLVFSQFTAMLSLIEKEIKARRYTYTKLTGATRKRDEAIAKFTEGDADIFLISLKAGGVGLNLVAADTVIHYDPWWNPAVENQATDRAYRIGQDKPVFVYKLIVENTVEEKILALQEKKKSLQEGIYKRDDQEAMRFSGGFLAALLSL